MKNAIIVGGWLITATLTLLVSITTLQFLRNPRYIGIDSSISLASTSQPILSYKHIVNSITTNSQQIKTGDARPILLARFLEKHNSPLKPYEYFGNFFTTLADQYGLDYRLLPSIAMQESNLCKAIPAGSFNCLGLGIHSKGTWGFTTFESNFEKAAQILRKNYIDQGLVTPEQIQSKYTPHSNGSWAFSVNQFMNRIESANY